MDASNTREEGLRKLSELTDDLRVATLVTVDKDGGLRGRPMAAQPLDEEGQLWFFTNDYAAKIDEVVLHPQVCLVYAEPARQRYVSVSGTAELVRDAERMQTLWRPELKSWFPRGLQDPDLALLRVDVVAAQYWDAPAGRLVQLSNLFRGSGHPGAQGAKLTLKHRIAPNTIS